MAGNNVFDANLLPNVSGETLGNAAQRWALYSTLVDIQTGITIGSNASGSVDQVILVARNVDDTVAGNGHCYSDSSVVTRSGTIGYNSYDAAGSHSGTIAFDHVSGFQSRWTYGSSGLLNNFYCFNSLPVVNLGTVTSLYGLNVADATGTGTITSQYGVYIAQLSKGASNFAFFSAGTTQSQFGGKLTIGAASTDDTSLAIRRTIDASIAGTGRAMGDYQAVSRTGTIGYNSYDSQPTYSGSASYSSHIGFFSRGIYGAAGTEAAWYDFLSFPVFTAGTITNRYGNYIGNPTGVGVLTNNYGLYIESQTKGATLNRAIKTLGTAISEFGGPVITTQVQNPRTNVTLANGANADVAISGSSFVKIVGPTGVFSVSGFTSGADGAVLRVYNSVAFAMTITNNASSTAANRILTLTGADVVLSARQSFATFIYDSVQSLWILAGIN